MATAPKLVTMQPRPAAKDSPLTPELKDFIDRAIVPALVCHYLAEVDAENKLAKPAAHVALSDRLSDSSTAAPSLRGR
jgi:hypothetical protein